MIDFYTNRINKRKEEGTERSLSFFEGKIDFFSNDYLGASSLSFNSNVPSRHGSTGSRLISGDSRIHQSFEIHAAAFFQAEKALLFNSGYDANLGFFSTIPQKGDVVLYDEYIHASIRDGLKLGNAKAYKFKHNDVSSLNELLVKFEESSVFVVVEGVYSMDGDCAPLNEVVEICSKYNARLIVDEAHSAGVLGEKGRGICHYLGVQNEVFARIVTFGKAYGSHGACILSSEIIINYLVNFCRTFIYTTALPPIHVERLQNLIKFDFTDEVSRLKENVKLFRKKMKLDVDDEFWSPIQVVHFDRIDSLKEVSKELLNQKIAIKPIYSPTVPVGKERLRICIHSFNLPQEIELLTRTIQETN